MGCDGGLGWSWVKTLALECALLWVDHLSQPPVLWPLWFFSSLWLYSQVLLDPGIVCHSQICFGQKAVTTVLKVLRLKGFLNGPTSMFP